MKILHLNHADIQGGAARAAYRVHLALRGAGHDSRMWVNHASAGDWTVGGPTGRLVRRWERLRQKLGPKALRLLHTGNPVLHSTAFLPSGTVGVLNQQPVDVLHLHWVQGEMLSVADIGALKRPVVWTLHDMWAFCGAEHYTEDFRWRDGYRTDNRPAHERGLDLNRWTFQRKLRQWGEPRQIITPSHWLADCVRSSRLMGEWPVRVVPNCIDTARWQPIDRALARRLVGLPPDVPLLLFGAMGGSLDPRKGFDLLREALGHLRGQMAGLELVVFGQLAPQAPEDLGFPTHYMGHLHDDLALRALYSAADVFVVPSRQDNLPNTAVESMACGTPVVAFRIGGMPDLVTHGRTGHLARPFDAQDLAQGIAQTLAQSQVLGPQVRADAVAKFSHAAVVPQFEAVYRQVSARV